MQLAALAAAKSQFGEEGRGAISLQQGMTRRAAAVSVVARGGCCCGRRVGMAPQEHSGR